MSKARKVIGVVSGGRIDPREAPSRTARNTKALLAETERANRQIQQLLEALLEEDNAREEDPRVIAMRQAAKELAPLKAALKKGWLEPEQFDASVDALLAKAKLTRSDVSLADPGPDVAPFTPRTASSNLVEDLERLAQLHKAGALSDREFERAKELLLEPEPA